MHPLFPDFKPLELTDKSLVESVTNQYDPYSDHNFVSLFSYNVEEQFKFSFLNDNLIVQMNDYITGAPFLTYIGTNKAKETIEELLKYSTETLKQPFIRLVPEHNLKDDYIYLSTHFDIQEEHDNFDYILSIEKMILLDESHFSTKRQDINHFSSRYPNHEIKKIDITHPATQQQMHELFRNWERKQHQDANNTYTEFNAIQRASTHAKSLNIDSLGLYDQEKLIGFSIIEHLPKQYIMAHFGKADYEYKGVFPYLLHLTAQEAYVKGAKYWNFQQDLGIEGMKKSKAAWLPVKYLRKYRISRK